MKEITNPGTTKFVSPNAGLQYTFIVDEKTQEKGTLKFVNGICEVETKSPLCKAAIEKWKAQFIDDGKGGRVVKGDTLPVPFTPFDEFQASVVTTPIRIEIGKGEYFEVTPQEIRDWQYKASLWDASQGEKASKPPKVIKEKKAKKEKPGKKVKEVITDPPKEEVFS
jgi:hypothetical protein